MSKLFATGHIVDGILVFMLLELIVLILVRKRDGSRFRPAELAANLGAGASLLLALRAALVGSTWQRIALCLLLALACHVGELLVRGTVARTR